MRDYSDDLLNDEGALTGLVKWFDGTKGFGFVIVEGIEDEFLLHRRVLNKINRNSIAVGSTIEFVGECSESRRRVAAVRSVMAPMQSFGQNGGCQETNANAQRFPARVRWFNSSKGYGFVNCYGSNEDVFVGTQTLTKSGLSELLTGEAVCVEIESHDRQMRVCRIHDWSE